MRMRRPFSSPTLARAAALALLMATAAPSASAAAAAAAVEDSLGSGGYHSSFVSSADVTLTHVNYTDPHDGALLMGAIAVPDGVDDGEPRPAVIVIPNWDGVNQYEYDRAVMYAEAGNYVVLAADMYGADDYQPSTMPEKIAAVTKYREDVDLMVARVEAAVNVLKNMTSVDPTRIALAGYCFGGSVALTYSLLGHGSIVAAAAFHGSLSAVPTDELNAIVPKILILSGGEDTQDSTKSVIDMEDAMNAGNATWQLTRYAHVEHSFTNFDGSAYNEHVDVRAHASTHDFLAEAFGEIEYVAEGVPEEPSVTEVEYEDSDGYALKGYVSYPEDSSPEDEPHPAVIVIHDASGIDEYEQKRITMLADMGYVGFVADAWGEDHGFDDLSNMTQLFALMGSIRDDVPLSVKRIDAAIATVRGLENVHPDKIALMGYCFGGTVVMNYALSGESDALGIVSFHGGLSAGVAEVSEDVIVAKMLIESGGDDDASSSIEDLEDVMEFGNADWEYSRYSGVRHAFTDWDEDGTWGMYDARADVRSWENARTFLADLFAAASIDAAAATTAATIAAEPGGSTTAAPLEIEADADESPATTKPPPVDGTDMTPATSGALQFATFTTFVCVAAAVLVNGL